MSIINEKSIKSRLFYVIFLGFICAIFCSCARYEIAPIGKISYERGIKILRSSLGGSNVQLELAQKNINSGAIVLFISAQNNAQSQIEFSAQNVSAYAIRHYFKDSVDLDSVKSVLHNVKLPQNAKPLRVFSYEEIARRSYDFINILQDFNIPTPTPSVNIQSYNITPMYYMMSPGFMYYSPFFSPISVQNAAGIAYMEEKRGALKVLLMNYLREFSLTKSGGAKGGFVVIDRGGIKDGTFVIVEVRLGAEGRDIHRFGFVIKEF